MLILTRRRQETLCIGDEITVTVLDVSGDRVRIGIVAPREITVLRQELVQPPRAPPGHPLAR